MRYLCLLCRPGFEKVLFDEVSYFGDVRLFKSSPGWILIEGKGIETVKLRGIDNLVFARSLFIYFNEMKNLIPGDRFEPIYNNFLDLENNMMLNGDDYSGAHFIVHWPDTNEGRALSPMAKSFQKFIDKKYKKSKFSSEYFKEFHVLFITTHHVILGWCQSNKMKSFSGGILRMATPGAKVSRSARKLAEALQWLEDVIELPNKLNRTSTCVDLGAAPGGWTAHMASLGFHVCAVDNGSLDESLSNVPNIKHYKQDAYKFLTHHCVDLLLCDMVDKPIQVSQLVAKWFLKNKCHAAIVNLKLPMKKKFQVWLECKGILESAVPGGTVLAKHLYHDRDEITCFINRA